MLVEYDDEDWEGTIVEFIDDKGWENVVILWKEPLGVSCAVPMRCDRGLNPSYALSFSPAAPPRSWNPILEGVSVSGRYDSGLGRGGGQALQQLLSWACAWPGR